MKFGFKRRIKGGWVYLASVAVILGAILLIDIRPSRGLELAFFRYYHLEKLNRFTSVLNPVLAIIFRPSEKLREIEVVINPDDAKKMTDALPDPYPAVFLDAKNAVEAKARVMLDGVEYQAEVRIRGKSPRHWQDEKKSLRLDFLGENPPLGIVTWHLVIPYDRYFISEGYSAKIAADLGLAVGRREPVWMTVNGVSGVYLMIEPTDNNMLERKGFLPGTLFAEAELGSNPAFPFLFGGVWSWRVTDQNVEIMPEFSFIEKIIDLTNNADDEDFVKEIQNLIDIDQFLTWQAHSVLISSDHEDDRHNALVFLHPVTGKLIFLPSDPGFYEYGSAADLRQRLLDGNYNKLAKRILAYQPWREQRDQIVLDYLEKHYDELLETLAGEKKRILPWLMRDPIKLHSNLRVWRMIKKNETFFRRHWRILPEVIRGGEQL